MKYRVRSTTFPNGEEGLTISADDLPSIRKRAREVEEGGTRVTLIETSDEVVVTIHHGERP